MAWLGLDIGGANLKAATASGWAASEPFALWRAPEELPVRLAELIRRAPQSEGLAITMTGELADCFATKAEGVRAIVDAAVRAGEGRGAAVYSVDGAWVTPDAAHAEPECVAAANWRALADFVERFCDSAVGLLIDIGSTTTDIIPLNGEAQASRPRTDSERMLAGQLVYTGVGRTPVCCVSMEAPLRGVMHPIAAEFFATTADVACVLGKPVDEHAPTADNRPLTADYSRARLARCFCLDTDSFTPEDAAELARFLRARQLEQLANAARRAASRCGAPPATVVVSGAGSQLAAELANRVFPGATVVSLADRIGEAVSGCAPAYALAVLADEARLP